ncbi:MAG: hypothetical protein A3I77_05105 [Gammaproteobacteria bacterium RIFCSPLOWO2_02_FULL_42_14]|nr:MAG: hypothetical protein A3B71_01670 [Gammaproteobacteria bacterium RIFCSPHIGHO2_02_FULL_42_43]OGT28161.1 MAG: hypothetical protein A2624_05305 [Gammaproteobacteria bacterium RIFCSPHIGHO2_01_FULL_42_8]OGT51159.1 MAG: hypothetical protein A3E54_02860 [Gammaproteobacteria bacterium RIFCSPHIGHO2_12_FULL_41_25]OGT62921.1 MAG: hypothetical protein A3I77_05105 [Gammaproteobacteria bacterium RIFCSPLOWO2_02_FULL_42_14]OGT86053.1 MAG: hypothetical protein A3G86_02660 [Gammaproteobacteria bacterium R
MNLPKTVDPIRLAKQHTTLEGDVMLRALPRLQKIHDQADGKAAVVIVFEKSAENFFVMKGRIQASIQLTCDRCNDDMQDEMDVTFLLSPVNNDYEAGQLPDSIDPCLLIDGHVALFDLIEDEILLNLPMVAKHSKGNCAKEFLRNVNKLLE